MSAEVEGLPVGDRYVVVNIPTTIVSGYLQTSPDESVESANARFRVVANLPSDLNLGYGIEESARNPFSHLNFFRQAEEAGGLDSFIGQLIAEMGASRQGVATQTEGRFRLGKADLSHSFSGYHPSLGAFLFPLQRSRTLVLGVESSLVKEVLGFVGGEAASSVLDAGIDTGWTKFAEQIGLNFGTTVALDKIKMWCL